MNQDTQMYSQHVSLMKVCVLNYNTCTYLFPHIFLNGTEIGRRNRRQVVVIVHIIPLVVVVNNMFMSEVLFRQQVNYQ